MFYKNLLFTLVALLFVACGGTGGDNEVLATVDGIDITAKEVNDAVAGQMGKLEAQIFQIRKGGLDRLVQDKIIETAAKKKKQKVAEFLKTEVDDKVAQPSEDEVKSFYEARKEQTGGKTLEEIKPSIINFLLQGRRSTAKNKLLADLRKNTKVKYNLEAPRKEIPIKGDDPEKGPKDAPITLVEYSDYQCPFCGRARNTIKQVMSSYDGKIRYIFKPFPLSFHKDAPQAHEASLCAGEQKKFWEYNDRLFQSQKALKPAELKKYAVELKLDVKSFNACLDSRKYKSKVESSISEGASVGVSGTPAFFINGIHLSGTRPFSAFKTVIDQELNK
jgi:protein-disulfide isomerase